MFNSFNINNMAYNLTDEYLQRYLENALKYSKINGLSIRYFHINMDNSKNFDYETAIRSSLKNFKYDLYEFIPIIEMNPPVQQIYNDPNLQGISYNATITLTIIGVQNPLPGDLFTFYDISGNQYIDKTEIYRVKNINYIRSMNNKIPIYQIEAEYAPLKYENLEIIIENNIINHYYFNSDLGNYFDEDKLPYYEYLSENIDEFGSKIESIYDKINASYGYCKFNSVIKFLQKNYRIRFKPIASKYLNYEEFNINDFLLAFDKLTYYINQSAEIDGVTNTEEQLYNKLEEAGQLNFVENDEQNGSISDPTASSTISINNNNEYYIKDILKLGSEIDISSLIIFSDFNCETQENEIIFIYNIDTNELKINSELYQYYLDLYKIMICYRELDPNFFDKLKLEPITQQNYITSGIYYSYLGELDNTFYQDYLSTMNYDPGYYLSYQDGVVTYSLISPELDNG